MKCFGGFVGCRQPCEYAESCKVYAQSIEDEAVMMAKAHNVEVPLYDNCIAAEVDDADNEPDVCAVLRGLLHKDLTHKQFTLIQMYSRGSECADVARELGISRQAVSRLKDRIVRDMPDLKAIFKRTKRRGK